MTSRMRWRAARIESREIDDIEGRLHHTGGSGEKPGDYNPRALSVMRTWKLRELNAYQGIARIAVHECLRPFVALTLPAPRRHNARRRCTARPAIPGVSISPPCDKSPGNMRSSASSEVAGTAR